MRPLFLSDAEAYVREPESEGEACADTCPIPRGTHDSFGDTHDPGWEEKPESSIKGGLGFYKFVDEKAKKDNGADKYNDF